MDRSVDEPPWQAWESNQKPHLEASPDGWTHLEPPNPHEDEPQSILSNSLDEHLDPWEDTTYSKVREYKQGSTIDWLYEEAAERNRKQRLRAQHGLRGILMPLFEGWRLWLVLIISGISIGYIGGMLDILVAWLSDLRLGRCKYGLFFNQSACCSGLEAGEICTEWVSWSQYFGVTSIAGQSVLQSVVYVVLSVLFAGSAAVLVQFYAPHAFHTGIPEIKAILGGLVLDEFLSGWTLLIKALGLALAVASGLSLGKEGPLVHVSCCVAALLLRLIPAPRTNETVQHAHQNETQRRKILAAAATAGVAVAFGSPLGGVLFGLEELDSALFSNEQLMWRSFVTSVVAAMTLAYVDPFGSGKLVLFQVNANEPWRQFELFPWLIIGVVGGVLGALLIRLNVQVAVLRRNSVLRNMPLVEVLGGAAITAVLSWPIVFMRDQTSTLVANLFVECDLTNPTKDYHGLCNVASMSENVVLLLVTAGMKTILTAWTFGMNVPAGVFLPTIAIGACLGRSVGILLQEWHRAYPGAWIFTSCPPEGICIYPGFYSVVGAAAMLGGVTRMTVSLVVILFELTGALSHVLPIMLAVMTSKFVGDYFGKGVYDTWIAMNGYPFIPPAEYRDHGETAESIMIPAANLVTINGRMTHISDLEALLKSCDFEGFPVVDGERLVGYVTRDRLMQAIADAVEKAHLDGREDARDMPCTFIHNSEGFVAADLSSALESAPMLMRKEMPLMVVVSTFQKINLRYILFTSTGNLTGLLTQRDIVRLLNSGFDQTNALSDRKDHYHATDWE